MLVLDAGRLTLNARCLEYNKGHGEVKVDSMLLLIANNVLNQGICTRILTSIFSLVFLTQMRNKNLCRKKISQVSMYVALFTHALNGDSQF